MDTEATAGDARALTRETQEIWEAKAAYWDARMGEGNLFHNALVAPAAERLLDPRAGETLLDVACGNGQFSRRLASLGARVVATDFSPTFLERARARTTEHADRIDYGCAHELSGARDGAARWGEPLPIRHHSRPST